MRSKLAALVLLSVTAGSVLAQGGGRGAGGRGQPAGPPPGGDATPQNRAQLEQNVRQRLAQMMKNQLGLNVEQMKKLQETNKRFDAKRRILVDQERDVRMSMRDELLRPDSARGEQMNGLLDRMIKVQHQRVDILEQEQAELARFLTPTQRVQYFGMEERVRRRMQQMRQQQMGGRGTQPMDGEGMQPMGGHGMRPMLGGRGMPPMDQPARMPMQPGMKRRAPPPDSGRPPAATPKP